MGTRVYVEVISKHRHLSLGGAWERPPGKSGLSLSPPTKRSNVSKLFQTAAMGQLFQAASSPILILMCNASFTRRACNEWSMWKYICFQQRSEDTHWHNALFQSPALPSSSPCVSLAPRPSTDLITDWWTCYLLLAVHYSAMRPCLLLSRAWKSNFFGGLANFNFYAAC